MKKVQDHYFRRAKKEGYPARSVYKLEEAQVKYRFLKKGDKVLDLGCRPGSWSMYAGQVVGPGGLVVGIDQHKGGINRKGKSAQLKILQGDIYEPEALAAIKEIAPSYGAVISDMAPHASGNKWADQQQSLNLARRAMEIASEFLDEDGCFYCKVFEGEDFHDFVASIRPHFKKVKVVKPKSSRSESREVFVLGTGFFKSGS